MGNAIKSWRQASHGFGASSCSTRILRGVVAHNDVHIQQGGGAGDVGLEDPHLNQIDTGGQDVDVCDVVVIQINVVQRVETGQAADVLEIIVAAVEGHKGSVLREVRNGEDVVVGHVYLRDVGQGGQVIHGGEGVVGQV